MCRVRMFCVPAARRTVHTWPSQQPLGLSEEPCCLWSDPHRTEKTKTVIRSCSCRPDNRSEVFVKTDWIIHLSLELLNNVSQEMLVEVFSSQEGVAVGGLHFKHSLLDLQDWDIKCTSAQIIDSNTGNTIPKTVKHLLFMQNHLLCCLFYCFSENGSFWL